ncbi:MAG: amidohydrolase family protein [Verrucomicrobia bacterium]|nr:amidohydrolase family protein [Verrucomicrobiota bacterium]MBI3869580.1 amidohydrolase family protein [Verrucomicrobiota bacterium]
MRIDAHQHFWTLGQFPHSWITEDLQPLRRNFGPSDLQPLLAQHGLEGSILVQTFSSLEETRWFLTLAMQHSFILGVVGWVDLEDPEVGDTIDALQEHPRFVGIRHVAHDEPDVNWLTRPEVLRGLGELEIRRVPFDLLLKPPHLAAALRVAERFPGLPLVVDHMAKPRIAARGWDDWADGISALARCPNVSCKLSGMITEADWKQWRPEHLRPYVDHVVEKFSPRRLLFGTDWPVCLLAGGYSRVVEALETSLPALTLGERAGIWGDNAARFYGVR